MLEKFAHTEVHVDVQDKDPEDKEKEASVAVDGNATELPPEEDEEEEDLEDLEEDDEEEDDEEGDEEELDEEQMVKDLVSEEGGEAEDEEEDEEEDEDEDENTALPPEEDDDDEEEDKKPKAKYSQPVKEFMPEGVGMRETELRQVLGIGYADSIDKAIRRLSYQRMEFASYEGRIERLEATNAALRWDNRIQYLQKEVEPLSTLPGTSRENAEKLIRLEEAGQPELAMELLGSWKDIEKKNKEIGAFSARLSPREARSDIHPLENKMHDWADKEGKSVAEAYAHFQQNDPSAWREFRTAARNGNN
jgi:hypothetical protein